MSKFFKELVKFKLNTCFIFVGTIIIILGISLFTGEKTIEISLILQAILVSIVGALFQMIAYSELLFKKVNYILRSIIFIVPFLLFLIGCVFWFNWFSISELGYWIIFFIIFMIAFLGISFGFFVYYKFTGEKFNKYLQDYKSKNNK